MELTERKNNILQGGKKGNKKSTVSKFFPVANKCLGKRGFKWAQKQAVWRTRHKQKAR